MSLPALAPFGPGRTLVMAIGDHELIATLGPNNELIFANPEEANLLDPEDYLAIRLYQNGDDANVLWEFAFEKVILSPEPGIPGEIQISADTPTANVNMVIAGYTTRTPDKQPEYLVRWESSTSAGQISPQVQRAKSGYFSTTLQMSRIAGSYASVSVDVNNGASRDIETPMFRVVPGVPAGIDIQKSGATAIGGIGEVQLVVTVKDQAGNYVADGTNVDIASDGDLTINSASATTNGQVAAVLKGLETPGVKTITIRSGAVQVQETVEVADVQLLLTMPSTVNVGETANLMIQATSPIGTLDGQTITLRQTHGELRNKEVTLSGGNASTDFRASEFTGPGKILATFAGAATSIDFEVVNGSGMGLSDQLLIGDRTTGGTVNVETDEGEKSVAYAAESTVTVEGTPGQTVTATIGDLMNPPIEPVLHYSMTQVLDNQAFDSYGFLHGTLDRVTLAMDHHDGFGGSFQFQDNAAVRLGAHSVMDKPNNMGFSLYFKPQAPGALVDFFLRSQHLTLETDRRLRYRITTDQGSFEIFSQPINLNTWHKVAAHYKNSQLMIEVDGILQSVPANGNLVQVAGAIALQLGFTYTGLMSDFRMIDWTEPYLMTFANNEIEMPLTIGADAKASALVRSTGQLGQRTYAKAPSGFSIAKGCFVPKAYADEATYQQMTKWWGKIKAGATQAAIMAITINQYVKEMEKNIARGALLGDVSTASGIVGDIAVGAIPFGDLRDIALQSYYLATGSDQFKKSVYTLSWIGLAADALIVTGVGEVVNAGIAGGKTFIKVLNTIDLDAVIALNKVLGKYFEMGAEAIKKGNWKLVEKCIPVLQLGAAIVIDDELRGPLLKVLGGAIHSIDDLETWMLYLAGWDETAADDPELIAGLSPIQRLVQPAHAGTISAFKKLLKELLAKYPPGKEEELGKALTDIFRSLNMVVDDAQLLKTIKYNLGTIVSTINIYKIGGRQAIEDLRLAGNIWRKIDDLVADIRKCNYSA